MTDQTQPATPGVSDSSTERGAYAEAMRLFGDQGANSIVAFVEGWRFAKDPRFAPAQAGAVWIVFSQFPYSDGFTTVGVFADEQAAEARAKAGNRANYEDGPGAEQFWVERHEVRS